RYWASPFDGATSLQRTSVVSQPTAQLALTSALPSALQLTRFAPSQRSALFGVHTCAGPLSEPSDGPGLASTSTPASGRLDDTEPQPITNAPNISHTEVCTMKVRCLATRIHNCISHSNYD